MRILFAFITAIVLSFGMVAPAHAFAPVEASTGVWEEYYDDNGSEISVVDGKRLVLNYYNGDNDAQVYFNTGGGSTFFLNYCNGVVQVSRKRFLDRVASQYERSISFNYNAERNSGYFVVQSGYFMDGEIYSCDPAGSNALSPRSK